MEVYPVLMTEIFDYLLTGRSVGLCMWTAGYKRRLMSILKSMGLVFEFMAETWLEYTICREEPPVFLLNQVDLITVHSYIHFEEII